MAIDTSTAEIRIRRASREDDFAAYRVHLDSYYELEVRSGIRREVPVFSEDDLHKMYTARADLNDFLLEQAEHFWVAEQAGNIIGYARSIYIDGHRELTEFFMSPKAQAQGVGKELLRRAFPQEGAKHRSIIATTDTTAQVLYMKAGMIPYTNIYSFVRAPQARTYSTDLQIVPMRHSKQMLNQLAKIDAEILQLRRDMVHRWLLNNREGFIYYRHGQAVGYGYVGKRSGPFALLDAEDYPAILAHAENVSATQQQDSFNFNVPTINASAIHYALTNGFRLDNFTAVLMLDKPYGRFENYALMTPMYFL